MLPESYTEGRKPNSLFPLSLSASPIHLIRVKKRPVHIKVYETVDKTVDTLTSGEWVYVKKILVHNAENYFNPKMFLDYIHTNMTRQGAIKILDHLTGYGILEKSKNKKGDNIYKLRQEWITYRYVT